MSWSSWSNDAATSPATPPPTTAMRITRLPAERSVRRLPGGVWTPPAVAVRTAWVARPDGPPTARVTQFLPRADLFSAKYLRAAIQALDVRRMTSDATCAGSSCAAAPPASIGGDRDHHVRRA